MALDGAQFLHNIQKNTSFFGYCIRGILYFCAWCYSIIVKIREKCYDINLLSKRSLEAPVISIGNITTGGTGKTPACIWLLEHMEKITKQQPILLSRGYGKDEVKVFSQRLPHIHHFMNSKRFIAGKKAISQHGLQVVFVLDDGFQHIQLQRQLDIVLVDATCPFGYKHILPRGFLRESLTGLSRADAIIITHADLVAKEKLEQIKKDISKFKPHTIAEAIHKPTHFRSFHNNSICSLQDFCYKKAAIFCGIGNPKGFVEILANLKIEIVSQTFFRDHHNYTQENIDYVYRKTKNAEVIITTAKDAVKIYSVPTNIPLWILDIDFYISNGKDKLLKLIQKTIENAKLQ